MCDLTCKICNRIFECPRSLGIHIKSTHKLNTKDYYDKFFKQPNEDKCATCGKPTKYGGLETGYYKHCCKECISKDKKVKDKKEQTCLNNWGVKNSFHSPNGRKQYYKVGTAKTKIINRAIKKLESNCNTIKNLVYIDKNTYEFDCSQCNTHRIQEHYITVHRIYAGLNPCLNCVPKIQMTSNLEKEMASYIKTIYNDIVIENDYDTISPRELDVYLPKIKLAFEFDGTYCHADKRFYKPDDKIYEKTAAEVWKHDKMKYGICNRKGIKLVRIKEYDWKNNNIEIKENIKSIINEKIKIFNNNIE